jgi:hypothetical protein
MISLNFSNVEELIFNDRVAQNALPTHYFSLFEQWRLAQQLPSLRQLGKHAVLDFLNQLNEDDIHTLEVYFDRKIMVEKLNYSVVKNLQAPLSEVCKTLCEVDGFAYFSTWRDNDSLYISFWR